MGKISIAIMDDDIWCLKSLGSWLQEQPHLCTLLWQTSSPAAALQHCLNGQKAQQPQVLLLDTSLDIASAPEICHQIRSVTDAISILGMSSGMYEPYIEALARAGAQGIMLKRHPTRQLPQALSILAAGKPVDSRHFKDTQRPHMRILKALHPHSASHSAHGKHRFCTFTLNTKRHNKSRTNSAFH